MKITINSYHAIAMWRWNLQYGQQKDASSHAALEPTNVNDASTNDREPEPEEEEDDDDVCGICRVAYDGCCPDCKTPGDECPLIWGECTHVFHTHCLLKWINTESSKSQCPMDRRPWVTVNMIQPVQAGVEQMIVQQTPVRG